MAPRRVARGPSGAVRRASRRGRVRAGASGGGAAPEPWSGPARVARRAARRGRPRHTGLRRSRSAGSWRHRAAAQRCSRAWRRCRAGVRCGAAAARTRWWTATCGGTEWREAGQACSACSRCRAALPACMWRAAWLVWAAADAGRLVASAKYCVRVLQCPSRWVVRLVGGTGWGWCELGAHAAESGRRPRHSKHWGRASKLM
jgi:hypothetical protein